MSRGIVGVGVACEENGEGGGYRLGRLGCHNILEIVKFGFDFASIAQQLQLG